MPRFRVTVIAGAGVPTTAHEVQSQNAVHAAASGLSLTRMTFAERIEVTALKPVPGRSASVVFSQCSHGGYGFAFLKRKGGTNGC